MIQLIFFIIMGILQGLTEPLPISSSGHVTIFKQIINVPYFNNLDYLVILNFASFLAIFIIYYKEIKTLTINIYQHLFSKDKQAVFQENFNFFVLLIISSIPTFISALLLKNIIDKSLTNINVLIISFFITAIFLLIASFKNGKARIKDISKIKALLIGIFQSIALFPGISRSGMVLSSLMLLNIKKEDAIKYTFFLYFPISIASFLLEIFNFLKNPLPSYLLILYSISFIVTFLCTWLAYNYLVKIVHNNKLWYFSIYCILLSIFLIIYYH